MLKKMLAAAAIVLSIAGAASSAQAGSDQSEDRGGIKIGPMGQVFGAPRVEVAPSRAFGQALPHQVRRPARKHVRTH
jgi:hypothetical protein